MTQTNNPNNRPDWEQAFAEYARESAPDLLPRILAGIDSSGVPSAESSPDTPVRNTSSGRRQTRFTRRVLYSAAGIAAAVLVGLLVLRPLLLADRNSASLKDIAEPQTSVIAPSKGSNPATDQDAGIHDARPDKKSPDNRDFANLSPDWFFTSWSCAEAQSAEAESPRTVTLKNVRLETHAANTATDAVSEPAEEPIDNLFLLYIDDVMQKKVLVRSDSLSPDNEYKQLTFRLVTTLYIDNEYWLVLEPVLN
ncbi:MAG: hypothetical protein J5532_06795 [Lachnospiraceae bacterium]|nr:hypothetical protein [Lachnospiraceae bacterium]